jgi:uncharacterized membrane protein
VPALSKNLRIGTSVQQAKDLAMENRNTNVPRVDASDVEHAGAMITGGLLLLVGLMRRGFVGSVYSVAGLALVARGARNYRPLYDALGIEMPNRPTALGRQHERVEASIEVDRPVSEVYRIWRNLENLPAFMPHLIEVRELDDLRSHWVAKAPAGMKIEWDAEIINDREDELIAWQSMEGSGVDNVGSVHFEATRTGGTRIRVILLYRPPGEALGTWVARQFHNDPQTQVEEDLYRFKQMAEGQARPAETSDQGGSSGEPGRRGPLEPAQRADGSEISFALGSQREGADTPIDEVGPGRPDGSTVRQDEERADLR